MLPWLISLANILLGTLFVSLCLTFGDEEVDSRTCTSRSIVSFHLLLGAVGLSVVSSFGVGLEIVFGDKGFAGFGEDDHCEGTVEGVYRLYML